MHRQALAKIVESGPIPAVHGVVRWRRRILFNGCSKEYRISVDETTIGRELKALGFAKLSARPRHYAQNEGDLESFKNFPATLAAIKGRLPKNVEIELWWADEARIGQKNKITRRWARKGTRPLAPRSTHDVDLYLRRYLPQEGQGAGLVLPYCDTSAMNQHLLEISQAVDDGAHAVLIVDQAGWHVTPKLDVPDNITLLFLPPRSPGIKSRRERVAISA
ncbi:IS630 family transposase [Rhizobium beringeri]